MDKIIDVHAGTKVIDLNYFSEYEAQFGFRVGVEAIFQNTEKAFFAVLMIGDNTAKNPTIRLPEVFVGEELVFEVTVRSGDGETTGEVRVRVEPVEPRFGETKPGDASGPPDGETLADLAEHTQESHGIGKIWASLVAFFYSARPPRIDR